ncbi:MAG TPA: hypothetical protein VGO96_02420 [Pyrinomonadaceae bacterium]|jgi:hypothetical protein|nr:hypothetical protein [Pyrinomonadaceae bacterium]
MKTPRSRSHFKSTRHWLLLLLAGLLCASPLRVHAHDGPPYAILVDKPAGPSVISVWGDPDVGTGTFFIIVEPPPNGTLPDDVKITLAVQPASGRLPEARYPATREALRNQVQYKSEVQFDAQEMWHVRVMLESAQGSGEISTEVEVTLPGLGGWGILLYLFPFVAVGILWARAILYRRTRRKVSAGIDQQKTR